jgi:hypothetical protein
MDGARAQVAHFLSVQAESCRVLGSPLYHHLLVRAAADALAGGPVWEVFGDAGPHPFTDAEALRLMAAVHRIVLLHRAPRLARYYPSVGGSVDVDEGAWEAFRATLTEQPEAVREFAALPCQTNEVARSAALLGGFLLVARETGLPLWLLEVGSSAGLQLRWDAFHYRTGEAVWGSEDSPVQLIGNWIVPPPHLDVAVEVVERHGCDPHPVDPATVEGRLTLASSVWADQLDRFERLRGALEVAQRIPACVDRASVGAWLPERLAEPVPGAATVVFHSIVLQYLPRPERAAFRAMLDEAGARATPDAPLYWLYLEPEAPEQLDRGVPFVVELTTWPGGDRRRLSFSGAHGANVRWVR